MEGPLVLVSSFSSSTHIQVHYGIMLLFVITRKYGQKLVGLHEVPEAMSAIQ